jgi:hypothetical protein
MSRLEEGRSRRRPRDWPLAGPESRKSITPIQPRGALAKGRINLTAAPVEVRFTFGAAKHRQWNATV